MNKIKEIGLKYNIEYINVIPIEHEGYNSVIVALLPYYAGEYKGCFSKYTRGYDYHKVGRTIMEFILLELNINNYQILIDVSPLDEKKLAVEAGLGVMGRNGLVINEKYGSFVFIMTALINEKTNNLKNEKKYCIDCGQCLIACPVSVISKKVCYEKCLSYLTQKKELTIEEEQLIKKGEFIWGCDTCQDVCPMNSKTITPISQFKKNILLNISNLDNLSNNEFKKNYDKYAMSYKGKRIIQRNMEIINSKKGEN